MSIPQSALNYEPQTGSLPERVLRWFALNPEEELSSADIAKKFDVAATANVLPSLSAPLAHGLLARVKGGTLTVGEHFAAWNKARQGPGYAAASVRPAVSKRADPPPLFDLEAIAINDGVVRPLRGKEGSGLCVSNQIDALFSRLQPNTHAVLPWAYRHLAKDVCTRWRKANPDKNIGVTLDAKAEKVILNRYA